MPSGDLQHPISHLKQRVLEVMGFAACEEMMFLQGGLYFAG